MTKVIKHPFLVGADPVNGYYVYHETTMEIWRYFEDKADAERFAYDANGNTGSFSSAQPGFFGLFRKKR